MKIFAGFLLAIIVIIAGIAGFLLSGIYNVSARTPHWTVTLEILKEVLF